jgi:hypothetical protein
VECGAVLIERGKRHRVRMSLANGQRAQHDCILAERDGLATAEEDAPLLPYRVQPGFHLVGVDGLGVKSFQPEKDRGHGAVARAGGGE